MFHVELRQFPHVARAFNLSADELEQRFVAPWLAGGLVDHGERRWAPERSRLTVLEGAELRTDEIGFGRGWPNALRVSEDVTDRMLGGGKARTTPEFDACKDEILAVCTAGALALSRAVVLAAELLPGRRVSEQLGFAEQAVWELLHEGRVAMHNQDGATVAREQWQPLLLDWASWDEEPVYVAAV